MGEAKRRGTYEQRVVEGRGKRLVYQAAQQARRDARWKAMSREERKQLIQSFALVLFADAGLHVG